MTNLSLNYCKITGRGWCYDRWGVSVKNSEWHTKSHKTEWLSLSRTKQHTSPAAQVGVGWLRLARIRVCSGLASFYHITSSLFLWQSRGLPRRVLSVFAMESRVKAGFSQEKRDIIVRCKMQICGDSNLPPRANNVLFRWNPCCHVLHLYRCPPRVGVFMLKTPVINEH